MTARPSSYSISLLISPMVAGRQGLSGPVSDRRPQRERPATRVVALAAPLAVTAEGSACDATRAVWHDRAAVRRHVGGLIANPQPAAATRPRAKAALSTELTELVESIEPVGDEIVCAEIGIGHVQVGGHPPDRPHAAPLRRPRRRGPAHCPPAPAFGGPIPRAWAMGIV